jgi:hypothetical protein
MVTLFVERTKRLKEKIKLPATPGQAWRGVEVSRRLKITDLKTVGT